MRAYDSAVSTFDHVDSIEPRQVWEAIVARSVHGARLTMAVVELDPGAVAAEHSHDNEQLGLVLQGTLDFRIGDESRELGPGSTYLIPSNTPHMATAGPGGAVVMDVFAPVRAEWQALEPLAPRPPRWPT